MNTFALLQHVAKAGVSVELDGNKLKIQSSGPVLRRWLPRLSAARTEISDLLRSELVRDVYAILLHKNVAQSFIAGLRDDLVALVLDLDDCTWSFVPTWFDDMGVPMGPKRPEGRLWTLGEVLKGMDSPTKGDVIWEAMRVLSSRGFSGASATRNQARAALSEARRRLANRVGWAGEGGAFS